MAEPIIQRHKTAIRRSALSKPVQHLMDSGLLEKGSSFFDYGCGLGDDVSILQENGFDATGYDPVYFPDSEIRAADIVNLGYVLNVIEDAKERKEVLAKAVDLTGVALSIAVLHESEANRPNGDSCADGILTNRGTFQRLYTNDELLAEISGVADLPTVTVSPGLVLLFKNFTAFSDYSFRRIRRTGAQLRRSAKPAESEDPRIAALITERQADWNQYIEFVNERGRPPERQESALLREATRREISEGALFALGVQEVGQEQFQNAQQRSRDDLLVFIATALIGRKLRMSDLPRAVQADVKYHYGSLRRATEAAMGLLHRSGKPEERMKAAQEGTVGVLEDDDLWVKVEDVDALPALLRAYVTLGTLFFGDYRDAEVAKLHLQSNKLTLIGRRDHSRWYTAYKIDFLRRRMVGFPLHGIPDRLI